jgi:uncharacterized protein YhbP (UPF0306 family)
VSPNLPAADAPARARRIIRENRYLTLATSDGTGPWAAPVAYVVDSRLDFYWASLRDATHSRHLEGGGSAAVAIFDSRATYEEVDGVQLLGHASEVDATEADRVHALYVERYPMYQDMPVSDLGLGRFRFYRFRPANVYILDDHPDGGDARLAVDIVELVGTNG